MTEQELLEIEARANAATPGPWLQYEDVPVLVAEVRRLNAENAELRKRIEESARTWEWYVLTDRFILSIHTCRWEVRRYEHDVPGRLYEMECRARAVGAVRPIDTIIRPEAGK